MNAHMFIDISQTVKLQFLLSELILARRKSKIETKSALSQDRTVVRNLLLFFIPKISLSKANVTSQVLISEDTDLCAFWSRTSRHKGPKSQLSDPQEFGTSSSQCCISPAAARVPFSNLPHQFQ